MRCDFINEMEYKYQLHLGVRVSRVLKMQVRVWQRRNESSHGWRVAGCRKDNMFVSCIILLRSNFSSLYENMHCDRQVIIDK